MGAVGPGVGSWVGAVGPGVGDEVWELVGDVGETDVGLGVGGNVGIDV